MAEADGSGDCVCVAEGCAVLVTDDDGGGVCELDEVPVALDDAVAVRELLVVPLKLLVAVVVRELDGVIVRDCDGVLVREPDGVAVRELDGVIVPVLVELAVTLALGLPYATSAAMTTPALGEPSPLTASHPAEALKP